jgi:uncharacterized membrane protein SirB2
MTHTHLTTIVLTIILFIFTLIFQKKGQNVKVLKMLLRVMYLLIILTGGMMFFSIYKITFLYVLKALLGLVMIGLFEMILSVNNSGKKRSVFWIVSIIVLGILVYLGIKLPLGIYIP